MSASDTPAVRSYILLFVRLLVVEKRPEQVQLKPAVAPIDIVPLRLVNVVHPRQTHVIPCPDPQPYRALVTQTGTPGKIRTVGETLYSLVLIAGVTDVEVDLRACLEVKSTGEPHFRHHRNAEISQVELI